MANYERVALTADKSKGKFRIDVLKPQQLEGIYSFVCGKDLFINLPTGYGKSLIYQLVPSVLKELGISLRPVVLVVSPLITLMEE